jgi:hypothetical protein
VRRKVKMAQTSAKQNQTLKNMPEKSKALEDEQEELRRAVAWAR